MLGIVDGDGAVIYDYSFAREGDDAFNDKFITCIHGVERVFKDDDLTTLRYVAAVLEIRPGDRQAVDYEAISGVEGRLHAGATDIEGAEYIGVN